MSFWELNLPAGRFFLDFAWLGALLVLGAILRKRIPVLQRYLIPANLLAGILGLVIGMNGLEWVDLNSSRLGVYVYHLLALLFIGLSLRSSQKKVGISSVKTGMLFIVTYLVQGILGLLITFCLIYTIMPDLFAGIGLLPPLAFGMNPGIAYTIGQNWEGYGFTSGGIVGLTFSAVGFLTAYTAGIWIVKKGIRKGQAQFLKSEDIYPDQLDSEILDDKHNRVIRSPGIIESFSLHFGLVGVVYLLTYLCLIIAEYGLFYIGAENEATTLWSFHFIFAAIIALAFRKGIDSVGVSDYVDDTTMTRISNLFMDLMIAASVAAISLTVVGDYWIPLLLISVVIAFSTWWLLRVLCYSVFGKYQLERYAAIFGNMTGTLQSALLLLRILDEKMQSPVSYNLVYGSGLALVLGFPLLLLINAPVHYFDDVTQGFWMVLFVMMAYLFLLLIGLYCLNGKDS